MGSCVRLWGSTGTLAPPAPVAGTDLGAPDRFAPRVCPLVPHVCVAAGSSFDLPFASEGTPDDRPVMVLPAPLKAVG